MLGHVLKCSFLYGLWVGRAENTLWFARKTHRELLAYFRVVFYFAYYVQTENCPKNRSHFSDSVLAQTDPNLRGRLVVVSFNRNGAWRENPWWFKVILVQYCSPWLFELFQKSAFIFDFRKFFAFTVFLAKKNKISPPCRVAKGESRCGHRL